MMERMGFNEAFEHIATDRGVSADVLRVQVDASIHEAFFKDDPEVKKWFEVLSAPAYPCTHSLGRCQIRGERLVVWPRSVRGC